MSGDGTFYYLEIRGKCGNTARLATRVLTMPVNRGNGCALTVSKKGRGTMLIKKATMPGTKLGTKLVTMPGMRLDTEMGAKLGTKLGATLGLKKGAPNMPDLQRAERSGPKWKCGLGRMCDL